MLFRNSFLIRLAAGEVTQTIRAWPRRPQARPGGRYRTEFGTVVVEAIEQVPLRDLTARDAEAAGYRDRAAMVADLRTEPNADVYRIRLRMAGDEEELPPPRHALLARRADLTAEEIRTIADRLARLDTRSPGGPWTDATLEIIAARPATRAGDLAAALGRERLPFKADVRKLKALGLTESLDIGYRLSPRGEAFRRARAAG